jgi:hypothetical protein
MISEKTYTKLWNPDLVGAKTGKKLTKTDILVNRIASWVTRPIALILMFVPKIIVVSVIIFIILKLF